jgi:hypothetical protein
MTEKTIYKSMRQTMSEMYSEDMTESAESGLKAKADKSGMPLGVLRQVYKRGVAAWKGGHRPGTTPQQWGMARVNSFVTKSSGTWGKADADLAKKVRGESAEFDHYQYQVNEQDEPASPDEGSMAMQQLDFMAYAAGKMKEHLSSGGEFPEWMQNKLSATHEDMKSLYANIDHKEAVNPAQQAAIAIAKKEKGEKPKGEK